MIKEGTITKRYHCKDIETVVSKHILFGKEKKDE